MYLNVVFIAVLTPGLIANIQTNNAGMSAWIAAVITMNAAILLFKAYEKARYNR